MQDDTLAGLAAYAQPQMVNAFVATIMELMQNADVLDLIKMSQQFNDELTEKTVDASHTPIVQGFYYDLI